MTGEPPPPTQTIPPGTPDEKLALLIATLLDIILTILEALPIPGFLRRPLQNRARHECAALLTRLLNTRVPAPATTSTPAQTPAASGPDSKPPAAPDRPRRTTRADRPASEPASTESPQDPGSTEQAAAKPAPGKIHRIVTTLRPAAYHVRPPNLPNFQKPAQPATQKHAQIVTIS